MLTLYFYLLCVDYSVNLFELNKVFLKRERSIIARMKRIMKEKR
jgi:hypothetical protein